MKEVTSGEARAYYTLIGGIRIFKILNFKSPAGERKLQLIVVRFATDVRAIVECFDFSFCKTTYNGKHFQVPEPPLTFMLEGTLTQANELELVGLCNERSANLTWVSALRDWEVDNLQLGASESLDCPVLVKFLSRFEKYTLRGLILKELPGSLLRLLQSENVMERCNDKMVMIGGKTLGRWVEVQQGYYNGKMEDARVIGERLRMEELEFLRSEYAKLKERNVERVSSEYDVQVELMDNFIAFINGRL
jgi:hypothetical protein